MKIAFVALYAGIGAGLIGLSLFSGCSKSDSSSNSAAPAGSTPLNSTMVSGDQSAGSGTPVTMPTSRTTADGLNITDLVIGTGPAAMPGDIVMVHYIGKLMNGTKFDSSYDRGEPIKFVLGRHEVIDGWDEGIAGMKVGGKRHLIIPANLAYGDAGRDVIPPNSTLDFTVELFSINGH